MSAIILQVEAAAVALGDRKQGLERKRELWTLYTLKLVCGVLYETESCEIAKVVSFLTRKTALPHDPG